MTKKSGLGRGLSALLKNPTETNERLQFVAVHDLQPGRYQPRALMDQSALEELAQSIRQQGLIQPILVRLLHDRYEIIAGERRWRAAKLAGLSEIPVMIREVSDENTAIVALIENIQREELNPLEEAAGLQRLIQEFGMNHQQAAASVGKSRSTVSNLLRLLSLTEAVQTLLLNNELSMGHARALLPLSEENQLALAKRVVLKNLSVRETERLAQMPVANPIPSSQLHLFTQHEQQLSQRLKAKVMIRQNKQGGGRVTIESQDLAFIMQLLEKV